MNKNVFLNTSVKLKTKQNNNYIEKLLYLTFFSAALYEYISVLYNEVLFHLY
jgi:hypothetical protein